MRHIRILSAITCLLSTVSCSAPNDDGVMNYTNPYVAVNIVNEAGSYYLSFLTVSNEPVMLRSTLKTNSHTVTGDAFGLQKDITFAVHTMLLGSTYHIRPEMLETHLKYEVVSKSGAKQEHTIALPTKSDLNFAVVSGTANTKSWKDLAVAVKMADLLIVTGGRIALSHTDPNLRCLLTNKSITEKEKAMIPRVFLESYLAPLASPEAREVLATKPTIHAGIDWRDVFEEFFVYATCKPDQKPPALDEISGTALTFYRIFCLHDLSAPRPISPTHTLLPFSLSCVQHFPNFVLINFDTVTHADNPNMLHVISNAIKSNLENQKRTYQKKTLLIISSSPLAIICNKLIQSIKDTHVQQQDLIRRSEFLSPNLLLRDFMNFIFELQNYRFKQLLLVPPNAFGNILSKITTQKSSFTIVHAGCFRESQQTFRILGKFVVQEQNTSEKPISDATTTEEPISDATLPPCSIEFSYPGDDSNSFLMHQNGRTQMVQIKEGKQSSYKI